jgi:3,4-dihydroxy-2-butanone 4-phosphate synthase
MVVENTERHKTAFTVSIDAPEVLIQEIRAVGDDLRMDWTLRTRA